MEPRTITTLDQLRIGDSFVYRKRLDPWRVMAKADKSGRVAVNQVVNGKTSWKHDELIRGKKQVMFLRHTVPVAGEECLVDDLKEGDVFFRPEDVVHEFELVKHGHAFSDVRRLDEASCVKAGRASKVIFVRPKNS
jgi:hypothetical protein